MALSSRLPAPAGQPGDGSPVAPRGKLLSGSPSRRRALGLLAAAAPAAGVLAAGTPAQAATRPVPTPSPGRDFFGDGLPSPSLRELAAHKGFFFGTAIHNPAALGDPHYARILAREFSIVSPENVMKWDTVEPEHGLEDFTAAQRIFLPIAHENFQIVRGHNLIWHNQLPEWLSGKTWTTAQLTQFLTTHVTDEVTAMRGEIFAWDVINEPLNEDGTLNQNIWSSSIGPDYIPMALELAHAADPNAKLYINDFNLESAGPKSAGMLALAQNLLSDGVPLHGIGFQGHLGTQFPYPASLPQSLAQFADLGLEVAITEADVRMLLPATPASLATQAQYYGQMLTDYLTLDDPLSFTVWGFTDAHSWVPGVFAGQGAACILDENLQPKPAYFALRQVLTS